MNNPPLDTAVVQHYRPLAELVPAHWQTGTITVDDDTPIHYTRAGDDKPPLILLHGVQVSGLSWLRTAQALEASYDVVMPDFRGHGHSGRLQGDVSAERLVQDIITLIEALALDMPLVIGHSMGADIAGRLAAAYPLKAVVLVDPALQNFAAATLMNSDTPPPWMQAIFDTLASLKTLPHAERMAAGLHLMPPGRPIMNEADYVSFIEGQAQFDPAFFGTIRHLGYLFEDPATIAQITCPALLLTARPMMPGANIERGIAAFTDHLPNGQHIHFEDSGHAIMFDQLDDFIQAVTAFFDRVEVT